MATVKVCETFVSLQGESTYAGGPCFFVRLAGCNLHCRYCDTPTAAGEGTDTAVDALVEAYRTGGVAMAEITGGEPLLQAGFGELARRLRDSGARPLLVETNGSLSLAAIPDGVIAVMDVKCPASGESAAMDWGNVARLRRTDEVKFVLSDRADFEWAAAQVRERALAEKCHAVLFSPVHGALEAAALGQWILDARLPVRLQVPLHKLLKMK